MIGVNTFYEQYRNMVKRRNLDYRLAADCFNELSMTEKESYTCDVSIGPDGRIYDFGVDSERKQFCNDNGTVSGAREIFVLAITHNTTGRPTSETRWGYNKIKNDNNFPLFGNYRDISLDISYVEKNRNTALISLGRGNLNYKGKQIWQLSMSCVRIPEHRLYYLERPEDDPDGLPTAIISKEEDGSIRVIRNEEALRRHAR